MNFISHMNRYEQKKKKVGRKKMEKENKFHLQELLPQA